MIFDVIGLSDVGACSETCEKEIMENKTLGLPNSYFLLFSTLCISRIFKFTEYVMRRDITAPRNTSTHVLKRIIQHSQVKNNNPNPDLSIQVVAR